VLQTLPENEQSTKSASPFLLRVRHDLTSAQKLQRHNESFEVNECKSPDFVSCLA
jgi:hypothetical protein